MASPRSGTETRQRPHRLMARFSDDEMQTVTDLADKAGISVSALIREAVLKLPAPRAARVPNIDRAAIARLLGELGKIGSNMNQIAKAVHLDRYLADMHEVALRDLMELRLACLQALGREPEHHPANPPASDSA